MERRNIAFMPRFFPSSQLPHFVEPRLLRRHLSERNVLQTIEKFVTPVALLTATEHPGFQCDSSDRMRIGIKTPLG